MERQNLGSGLFRVYSPSARSLPGSRFQGRWAMTCITDPLQAFKESKQHNDPNQGITSFSSLLVYYRFMSQEHWVA